MKKNLALVLALLARVALRSPPVRRATAAVAAELRPTTHGARRRVADRDLHRPGPRVRAGPPRRQGQARVRLLRHPGPAGRRRRARRRAGHRRHGHHGQRERRARPSDPQALRDEHHGAGDPEVNPAGITTFPDLDGGDVTYVACVETAPCGKVAAALIEDNHVTSKPASLEVDVKAVLAKVDQRRGRRRPRLRHRRGRRRRRGRRPSTIPKSARRADHLPDRDAPAVRGVPTSPSSSSTWSPPRTGQQVLADAGFGSPPAADAHDDRPRTAPLGRAPLVLLVPGALAAALLVVPLVTLVLDTPWGSFLDQLSDPGGARRPPDHRRSRPPSPSSPACCSALPLAWLLARVEFPGRSIVRAAGRRPAGAAAGRRPASRWCTALGRNGLVGSLLRTRPG